MADAYNLWRRYHRPPYTRWALTLVPSGEADEGYRVADHDPAVADGVFLHALHQHLRRPHPVHRPVAGERAEVDRVEMAHRGDPGHLAEAVRTVPGAVLRAAGRPS